jgi:UDPglucose 6-dehydrogenase
LYSDFLAGTLTKSIINPQKNISIVPKRRDFFVKVNIYMYLIGCWLKHKTVTKIRNIIIVGAGIVGTSTGKGLIKKGYNVLFVDKNPDIIKSLEGEGYRACLPDDVSGLDTGARASMFCVDTPLGGGNENNYAGLDLGNLISAVSVHAKWLGKSRHLHVNGEKYYHLIVIRSTVPPGTTRGLLLPLINKYSGLTVGEDLGLCMHPEFLRTVSAEDDYLNPRATIIGQYDSKSGDFLEDIYSEFEGEKIRVDLDMAEFMKLIHNCFNAMKISFSNEMWQVGKSLGIDANLALRLAAKTAEGLWNPNYGLVGGQPYGGHCLPKDTKGFEQFAQRNNTVTPLLSAVVRINRQMEEMAKLGKANHATIEPPSATAEQILTTEKS